MFDFREDLLYFVLSTYSTVCILQDFNIDGTKLVSCGMDHSLKMWRTDTEIIHAFMKDSYDYNASKTNK